MYLTGVDNPTIIINDTEDDATEPATKYSPPSQPDLDVSTGESDNIDTSSSRSNDSDSSSSVSQSTSEPNKHSRIEAATMSYQEEWEVGEILDERKIKRRKGQTGAQFLIRWKNTWVDESDVNAPELVQQFREGRARN